MLLGHTLKWQTRVITEGQVSNRLADFRNCWLEIQNTENIFRNVHILRTH